jgi:hypothetical protein
VPLRDAQVALFKPITKWSDLLWYERTHIDPAHAWLRRTMAKLSSAMRPAAARPRRDPDK